MSTKWQRLAQERNFAKKRIMGCIGTLNALAASKEVISIEDLRTINSCRIILQRVIATWDPRYISKLRSKV